MTINLRMGKWPSRKPFQGYWDNEAKEYPFSYSLAKILGKEHTNYDSWNHNILFIAYHSLAIGISLGRGS